MLLIKFYARLHVFFKLYFRRGGAILTPQHPVSCGFAHMLNCFLFKRAPNYRLSTTHNDTVMLTRPQPQGQGHNPQGQGRHSVASGQGLTSLGSRDLLLEIWNPLHISGTAELYVI